MTDSLPVQAITPMLPANETERLAALYRYQVLDTPAEAAFDRLTALAARLFKTPTVLISLVDESRVWFKSSIGCSATEMLRNEAICSFAVLTDRPLIVPDTRLDDRFSCNPFVQCEPGMRFYAGAPLVDRDGFNLGTLCLEDTMPHDPLTAEEEATLVDLAAMVVDELELRLAARQIASVDAAIVEITQGVSRVTGGAFFDELVRHFAKVLGADYVYIGLVEGTEPKMMKTIATCVGGASPVENRGNIVDNLEYRLQDTPCWEAIQQRKICCHPRNVQALFPNAPLLKPLSVESYISIPFYSSDGNVLGLLGVMDGKPLADVHLAESLLTIFATRIATELERQQSELILVEQTRLLELVATGQSLDECLSAMCRSIAILSRQTRACVLLTDNLRTKFPRSITPDFPPSLSQGLKDAPINELAIGTCGTAVYCSQPVTCSDIAQNESWSAGWRDLCIAHGIRACHSVPIMGIDHLPVGSVMLCFSGARLPTEWEYKLGEFGTKIASITIERRQAEEELHQSQLLVHRQLSEIEAIYQTAPIGLAIFDRQLRYVRLNQRLAEMNGVDIDDHIGRTLREIVPSVADEDEPLLNSIFTTGEPLLNIEISGETQAQPGVERTWIQNCYPLRDETGQIAGINVVVQEITDRKRAEAALAERNQELISFAYTVSHDLKAPLRAISNLSVWIEEDLEGKLPPDTQVQFDLLRTRVKRMESTIDSLLLYARAGRQGATVETFDFAEFLAEIIDSLAPPEGFKIDIQPPLPTLTTKRVFLSQVFANLISNAIKHHNSVTGHLDISAIEHPDCHEFIIRDDGPGIAPEHHERVFAIFQTLKAKDNSDSTGIGLAIVKKIVETEQGTIRLESSLGEGTTFYVTWPKSHG